MIHEKDFLKAIKDEPWGPAYIQEFDRVIAANIVEALNNRETLYEDLLSYRVGYFCAPLDGGLQEKCLGVIPVKRQGDEQEYQALNRCKADLAKHPRGHWAIFQNEDGGYDHYTSNGLGGTGTRSGNKFLYNRPDAPNINFHEAYASVISYAVYTRRYQIDMEVKNASVEAASIQPMTVLENVYFQGRTYPKITVLGRQKNRKGSGPDEFVIRASKRGVKAIEALVSMDDLFAYARPVAICPARYDDPRNVDRLLTLLEKRVKRAQAEWNRLEEATAAIERMKVLRDYDQFFEADWGRFGTKGSFDVAGDTLHRTVFTGDDASSRVAVGKFAVAFAPGSDEPVSRSLTPLGA